jgi:preprotein translocase subunit SecD
VIGLLLFSLFVDGAGYLYRVVNHYPLSGSVVGLPPHFGDWQLYIHRGLDLSGGTHLELQLKDLPPGANVKDIQQKEVAVIERRINSLGVSEPSVRPEGNDRISVDIAGVTSDKAQKVIGKTAKLVYTKWVKDPKSTSSVQPGYRPELTALTGDMITNASAGVDQQTGTQAVVNVSFNSQGADLFGKLTQDNVNACPQSDCPERHLGIWLDLTQADINQWDEPGVADKLAAPPDRGGKLLTDPTTQQPIPGGSAVISGSFTPDSAKELSTELNSGALPATTVVLQSTDVGASLGSESVKQSLAAGLLGLLIVIVFMVTYYRIPGLLASLALLFYAGVVLAIFKVVPVTLTLAGMAGFVLSVGMAVDANVLIFERFKEEMRSGRTIGGAVDAAIRRAYPAIRDSNISTIITSTLLVFLGTGPVKGFAVTLLIGVVISFISAVVVTHNLLAIVLNFGFTKNPGMLGVDRGRAA